MRIALCLSGHMRSYKKCIDNIKQNIFQDDNIVDVFINTWENNC
jgi:hypothetical protein